jgi:hypothetical protein
MSLNDPSLLADLSAKFWLIVQPHFPWFEEYNAWLKDNEDRMRLPE